MILNLRGGLGNQIIQLSYLLNNTNNAFANTNAIKLRDQLKKLNNITYIDSRLLNYSLGTIRKIISLTFLKTTDIKLPGLRDGYFQYGDITNIIPIILNKHLSKQIYFDTQIDHNIDIVLHIRGGDYFTQSAQKVYEVCNESYYLNALLLAEKKIAKNTINVFIVTNDKKYASFLLKKILQNKTYNFQFYYKSEWQDFSLIYRATIAIIPNSTFSLTARMLCSEKKTYVPKKWFTERSGLIAPYCSNFTYI